MADSLKHAYGEWQWRSAAVWAAYERWAERRGPDQTLDFAAYRVALDLEEQACRRYMDAGAAYLGSPPRGLSSKGRNGSDRHRPGANPRGAHHRAAPRAP